MTDKDSSRNGDLAKEEGLREAALEAERRGTYGNIVPEGESEDTAYAPGPSTPESTVATTAAVAATGGEAPSRQATLWGDAWRQLRKNPLFVISFALVVLFTVMAIAPGLFTNRDPKLCDLSNSVESPSASHWFGYDVQGCDYFARVVYGARVSMTIGFLVVIVEGVIALFLGSVSGYYGGLIDSVIARFADIIFAIPITLGGIVLLSALNERGVVQVALVLVLLGWPLMMRLVRSSVLSVKEADYVQAARSLGAGDVRLLRTHILPNAIAPAIVYGTITVGIIIAAEAALSFIGAGLQLPEISWGLQIAGAQTRIATSPHLLLFPSAFLSILVLSFILMGDALRDALDPKLRR